MFPQMVLIALATLVAGSGPGLPKYLAAGLSPTSPVAFSGYFAIAALIWTPLFVGVLGFAGGLWAVRSLLLARDRRRRFVGFVKRKLQ